MNHSGSAVTKFALAKEGGWEVFEAEGVCSATVINCDPDKANYSRGAILERKLPMNCPTLFSTITIQPPEELFHEHRLRCAAHRLRA